MSREEPIELELRLQRSETTSRISSKPPAMDRTEKREQSKPGGAKPGHEGHSRVLSDDTTKIVAQHAIAARVAAVPGTEIFPPSRCDLKAKIGRARHQLLVLLVHTNTVEPTNNDSERLMRPAVVQRKLSCGYRAMFAAEGETAIRTVVDTARLAGSSPFGTILKTVSA